jgi:hypothetical protein
MKSYKNTKVHWGKSQAKIMQLLSKQGIVDVRFTMLESRNIFVCEFNKTIEDKSAGVRIQIPIPDAKDREQVKNQIHRALFYYLKSKFEAMDFGLVEFLQEFMPFLVIQNKAGRQLTMGEAILPQYQKNLKTGQQEEIKMLPE